MKLKDYREKVEVSFSTTAEELGIVESQLWRYESGLSIPRKEIMLRIKEWSKGCVQPNDFYLEADEADNDNKL